MISVRSQNAPLLYDALSRHSLKRRGKFVVLSQEMLQISLWRQARNRWDRAEGSIGRLIQDIVLAAATTLLDQPLRPVGGREVRQSAVAVDKSNKVSI